MTSPVKPSIESQSPSLMTLPADPHDPGLVVDVELLAACDADLAHLARDQRRMAGHAAARREDALADGHAADVVGAGLDPHEQHLLALCAPGLGVTGVEGDDPGGGARPCG